jgi:hypothetical protein
MLNAKKQTIMTPDRKARTFLISAKNVYMFPMHSTKRGCLQNFREILSYVRKFLHDSLVVQIESLKIVWR